MSRARRCRRRARASSTRPISSASRAEAVDGAALGTVNAVEDFGAGPLLELVLADGRPVLVPFTEAVVPVVDMAGGRVVIDPPAGLLDAEAERRRKTTAANGTRR